jgi:hypothetical protein
VDKIQLKEINFSVLKKYKIQGTKSTIYECCDQSIKMLDGFSEEDKKILYNKFLDMDGLVIDGCILPKSLIIENDRLVGYTMENFKNSINIFDYFIRERYADCYEIFSIMKDACSILKNIHKSDIICQDLSFNNILINQHGDIKFCDMDGCTYKGINAPFISVILRRFLINYRKEKVYISKNLDRISFMLSFYLLIYYKELQKIPKKEYQYLVDRIKTLENMQEYAKALVNKDEILPEIPYLDELILDNDDYLIDRNKQLSLVHKLFKNKKS